MKRTDRNKKDKKKKKTRRSLRGPVLIIILVIVLCLLSIVLVTQLELRYFLWSADSLLMKTAVSRSSSDDIINEHLQSRRVFLRYEASKWEREWMDLMEEKDVANPMRLKEMICTKIKQDSDIVRQFLNATCTRFPKQSTLNHTNDDDDWCMIDDTYRPIHFHRGTGQAQQHPPKTKTSITFGPLQPLVIAHDDNNNDDIFNDDIFSKMVYRDNVTQETYWEYIEPLAAYLRHPLTCCETEYKYDATQFFPKAQPNTPACWGWLRTTRTQYVYPSLQTRAKFPPEANFWFFDAGASDWTGGRGGPSLGFFVEAWERHGINFTHIHAYEASTNRTEFYKTVPQRYQDLVDYHQVYVQSRPTAATTSNNNNTIATTDHHVTTGSDKEEGEANKVGPFVPEEIVRLTSKDDYVMFKLDIDSPGVEEGTVEYLLQNANGAHEYIDEFWYEFHLEGSHATLAHWYRNFAHFRHLGVRAHSWI